VAGHGTGHRKIETRQHGCKHACVGVPSAVERPADIGWQKITADVIANGRKSGDRAIAKQVDAVAPHLFAGLDHPQAVHADIAG
jgi:hypothetical protein